MSDEIRTIGSRVVYENPWVRIDEDDIERPDGSRAAYAVMRTPDYAVVIPFDGARFHLVEQYRYCIGRRVWEFPQGTTHGEQPDDPRRIAEAELAEETGLRAEHLEHLGFLHDSYGHSTTGFHVFLATGLTFGEPRREHEEQDMRTASFTLDEIWGMVDDGRITDASTVSALALLARRSSAV